MSPLKRAPVADRKAREFLRKSDPVLARIIDANPGFRPRGWMDELPPLDAFGTLIFQVAGQQLSVASTRAIITHLRHTARDRRSPGVTGRSRIAGRQPFV